MQDRSKPSSSPISGHLATLCDADPDAAARVVAIWEVVLAVEMLDLEPARPLLAPLYSDRKGGKRPRDPVSILRSLVLMSMLGRTSVNDWVDELRGKPELRILSGWNPPEPAASVGTFYGFFHRLLDGPYVHRCAHFSRPSERFSGSSGRFLRSLTAEKEQSESKKDVNEPSVQKSRAASMNALALFEGVLPADLCTRLNEILLRCGVLPSAERGLLGETERLDISGDGTAISSHADGHGEKACDCTQESGAPQCSCGRYYSDPTARWGYDSHRDVYFFGFRLHTLNVTHEGFDSPMQFTIAPANTADVLMAPDALVRLKMQFSALAGDKFQVQFRSGIFDMGYDARPFYELLGELGAAPIIPMRKDAVSPQDSSGQALDEHGRPICKGNLVMRQHQPLDRDGVILYNCPVKRPTHRNGLPVIVTRVEECPLGVLCEPNSKMGPFARVRTKDDPRRILPILRDSPTFSQRYDQRTASERINSTLKSKGSMATGAFRREHIAFTFAIAHAIERHAKNWVRQFMKDRAAPKTIAEVLAYAKTAAGPP